MGSGVSRPWGRESPKGYRDSRQGVLGGLPYPPSSLLAWPGQKQEGEGKKGPVGDARASAETSALLLLPLLSLLTPLLLLPLPWPLPLRPLLPLLLIICQAS